MRNWAVPCDFTANRVTNNAIPKNHTRPSITQNRYTRRTTAHQPSLCHGNHITKHQNCNMFTRTICIIISSPGATPPLASCKTSRRLPCLPAFGIMTGRSRKRTWTRGARNPMFLAAGRAFLLWSHTQKIRLVYCIGQLNQDQKDKAHDLLDQSTRNPSLPIGWWSRVTLTPFCNRSKHALCLVASCCRDLLV